MDFYLILALSPRNGLGYCVVNRHKVKGGIIIIIIIIITIIIITIIIIINEIGVDRGDLGFVILRLANNEIYFIFYLVHLFIQECIFHSFPLF